MTLQVLIPVPPESQDAWVIPISVNCSRYKTVRVYLDLVLAVDTPASDLAGITLGMGDRDECFLFTFRALSIFNFNTACLRMTIFLRHLKNLTPSPAIPVSIGREGPVGYSPS